MYKRQVKAAPRTISASVLSLPKLKRTDERERLSSSPIAVNTSVFVGYKVRGFGGAVAALLGSVLPSFVIILAIALLFADIRHNPVVDAAFKGMRPAVVALIVVPVISLAREMHWAMFAVIAASALAVWYLGWSPIYILIAAAAIGIAWTLFIAKKAGK